MSIAIRTEREAIAAATKHPETETIRAIHYATGESVSIELAGGMIGSIAPLSLEDADNAGNLPMVGPGLVDLQINGYAGRDFNALPISETALPEAVHMLWREGVTSFFPTVITNAPEAIARALQTIASACEADSTVANGVAGIHLEGPFISPEDGPRGAHAREFVRPPDWDEFQRWQAAAGGRIRILTMSPEWSGSTAFIERCAASGVTLSIGHTAATSQQIADAVSAGARMSTHLGNGCHLNLPRHPNYLWEQLAQDSLWTCLIAAGFHVPDQLLKVVMKVKGARAMLVSDAVALAGMPAGEYSTPVGRRVVLTPAGRLHLAENDKLLAGSAQMLTWGIAHLVRRGLATLAEAWEMASTRPATFMGLKSAAGLTVGAPADMVVFRRDAGGAIHIQRTYVGGECVYAADERTS